MMSTKTQAACPKCQQLHSVADSMLRQTLRCGKCGALFVLSSQSGSAGGTPTSRATVGGAESAARSTSGGEGASSAKSAPSSAGADGVPSAIGRFPIRRRLGHGQFGDVYLAYHPRLDIEVAIKMLRAEAKSSEQAVERFKREAKILAKVDHSNVQRVYDFDTHGDDFYIVSAYIAGSDLSAIIPAGGLEPRRAVRLTVQMLRALGAAHKQGIVHRDVKPANIRVNDQDMLFVMDFGLAGWDVQEAPPAPGQDPMRLTRAGSVAGTPAYMAPEQASGLTGQAGPEADLYSAGVVLHELLTGHLPFEAANLPALLYAVVHIAPAPPSQLRAGLDPRLDVICLQALAKRPQDRFRTAEAFAAALEDWLDDQPADPGAPLSAKASRTAGRRSDSRAMATLKVEEPLANLAPLPASPPGQRPRQLWVIGIVVVAVASLILATSCIIFLVVKGGKRGAEPTRPKFFESLDKN